MVTLTLTVEQANVILELANAIRAQRGAPRGPQRHPHQFEPGDPWLEHLRGIPGDKAFSRDVWARLVRAGCFRDEPVFARSPFIGKRIAACMRELGWQGPKTMRMDNVLARGFTRL